EQQESRPRPHDGLARWDVADQRLVRPVARVGNGVARARGSGRPSRPEEERRELTQPLGIADGAGRNRIFTPALTENGREVLLIRLEGAGTDRFDAERSRGWVIPVGAQGQP